MDFYKTLLGSFDHYNLFVSHAWKYDDAYNTVCYWLNNSDLRISNYSVPQHDPLDANNKRKLREKLTEQIRHASVVIVISGMYAAYSEWIDYEIDEAVRMGKVIIGLKPWGQQRIPLKIQENATEIVGWNAASVIQAIKKY